MRRYEINARIGGEFQINDRRISEAGEIYFTRTVQDQQKWLLKTRSADQTLFQEQIAYWLQVPLHAHLLAVGLQVERHEGLLFMLQPIIQDEEARRDLGEWLQDGVLPLATALKITLQIASGLNALHEAGMVHGNIKPGHVLLRHEGNIMLTDFCPPDQVTVDASNAPYLAPETSRDIRSDIYALGSLLYQMLTGKSAFVGSTLSEIRAAHETSTHESLSDDVPAALVSLIERCLQHDPMQRYQTPAELLDDLALIYTVSVGEIPSEVAPPQIPPLQIHWSRGQAHMALQQAEKAIENFNAALEIKPDYVPALVMRGSAQYRLGNYDAALADLNAAASIDDNDPLLHSRRGMTHLSLHNYENALADFDTALQRNPQNAEALYYRADTYQAMGESDKALIDLERLREFMPTDIKGLLATGNVLHDLRRHEDALLMYQQAHEQMPEDATILTARGSAYAMLGLMQKALQDFEQALALNPLAVTYARRGDAYVNLGQPEKALEDYTQALELDSYEISAVVNRGATLQQMGRYEEALPDLTRAIELFPDSAVAYTNRSQAYRALNRLEEALADAEKSVELDPDKAATYVTRGILYRMLERDEEALADYQKALEINPGLAQIHHNIAVLHIQRDRKEAALPHLEQAARLGSAQSGMLASQIRDELSLTQPDSIRRSVEENNPLTAMFMPESVSESTAAEAPSTQSASQEMRTESANASRTLLGRSVQFKPGDHINDIYEVHQALVGGMGEVYLCLNRQTNLPVALKSFQRRFMNSAQIRSLFEQEVATWISLGKHPNIVHCMHTVHVGDRPFAVLEWVVGEQDGIASLRDRLERGSLPVGNALRIALHICRGLIHAAEKQPGIVHRDLKPDNVLLASGGIAKITDFGLAKVVADDASEGALNPTDFSKSNQGGTPLYMAPEQWAGGAIDARTDAYAVGAILYEMLTGNKLFNADSRDELRHLHEQGAVPSLSIAQEFTAEIDTVLQTCLAKDKSERYETIQALYEALHDIYRQVNGAPLEDISDEEEMTVYDYISRGYTYSGLQLHEAALADLNKAVELAPHWPHAYIKRAAALNNTGRYKEALDDLNQAIRLDPTNDEAYFRRSYSYQGQGQHKQALADMQRAAELVPRKPEYVLGVHRLSTLESMNPDQLRPVVQSMTPQSAIEYGLRANLYSQLGDIDAAIADYERALQLDPLSSVNLLQYGMMLLVQEKPQHALEALEKAAEVGHPRARLMLPDLHHRMGLVEQAPSPEDEAILCAAWAQDVKMLALHSWRYPFMNGEVFRKRFAVAMTEDADPRHRYLMEKRLEWLHELQQYLLDHPQKPDAQVYHMAGLASINVGLHSIAILHLNEVIDMQPENAEVFANRGKVYAKIHNFPAALADLDRSLELADNADTYYTRAVTYARQNNHEYARRDLEKSLQLNPQQQHAPYLLAQMIHQLDGLEAAQPYFEQAARAGSREAAQHLAYLRYQHRSDLRQQIDALSEEEAQSRLAMLPSNAQGNQAYERGLLLLRIRRFDEAVAQLDRFIAENPRAGYGYSERARAHEQRGEYAAALDDSNRAIEHNPGDPALFVLRARIYQHLKQPQDARYDLDNAILLNPGYAVAYRRRAMILRDQGELETALEDFIRAAELGLEDRVHEDIQTLQAQLGQVVIEPGESTIPPEESGGLPVVPPVVPAAPEGDAEMYYNRAVLQFERNNQAAAMEDVKRAIELDPNFGKAYSLRAVLYSLRGEKEREKQDAIRGIDLNPRLKELMQRGAQLTMEKQHEEGLRVLDEALELDPYCTMLYFSRATALMELGRDQEILENAKRARKLGLPNLEIMAAMSQVKRQQENPGKFAFDTIQAADTKDALQEIMRNNTNLLEPPMIAEVYQYAHRTIPAENARSWETFRERMEWMYQIGAFFLENPRTDQERDEALEAFLKLRSPQGLQQWLNQYPFATGFQFRQQLRRRAKEEQTSGRLLPLLNQLDQYSASQPPAAAMYRLHLGLAAFHRAQNREEMVWAVEDHPVLASNVKTIQQMISQHHGAQRDQLVQQHKWLREVTGKRSLWDQITNFFAD